MVALHTCFPIMPMHAMEGMRVAAAMVAAGRLIHMRSLKDSINLLRGSLQHLLFTSRRGSWMWSSGTSLGESRGSENPRGATAKSDRRL